MVKDRKKGQGWKEGSRVETGSIIERRVKGGKEGQGWKEGSRMERGGSMIERGFKDGKNIRFI
jgi:hypothetical protein